MHRVTLIVGALLLTSVTVIALGADPETTRVPPNSSEPTKCFRLLSASGLNLTVGIALDACGGSLDGGKTVACLIEAWASRELGGLGLTVGQGVDLCRAGGKRQT